MHWGIQNQNIAMILQLCDRNDVSYVTMLHHNTSYVSTLIPFTMVYQFMVKHHSHRPKAGFSEAPPKAIPGFHKASAPPRPVGSAPFFPCHSMRPPRIWQVQFQMSQHCMEALEIYALATEVRLRRFWPFLAVFGREVYMGCCVSQNGG